MEFAYSDIIDRQRPIHTDDVFGRIHPRMPVLNRAKIFAPFAALRGFEAAIAAKEVQYVDKRILDADEEFELNRRLCILYEKCKNGKLIRANAVVITAEFYTPCRDKNSDAYGRKGLYHTVTGLVQKMDVVEQYLVVDGTRIRFKDIGEISDPNGVLFELPEPAFFDYD